MKEQEGEGSTKEMFMASRECFDRFKYCSNLDDIHTTGEAASMFEQAAAEFPFKSKVLMET